MKQLLTSQMFADLKLTDSYSYNRIYLWLLSPWADQSTWTLLYMFQHQTNVTIIAYGKIYCTFFKLLQNTRYCNNTCEVTLDLM